ncbi:hypothetical protein AKJ40_03265 [candidate division MSBL1 archaeon SCGC-AAA259M10]|uniref:Uncharacterized protein n=1 Tax=candidate division MSBL1 archaeon SCGC-AAA259M10 TaxID=1698270 RepID=A0A133UYY4_9EURY|nr:hypothetical protein AKJ40_03265 [candidate division MSBL1 archaeon SCGC-AAA259M10]
MKESEETIDNQLRKPTKKPTLRWIFQLFEDVHYVKIEEDNNTRFEVENIRPDGETALKLLGSDYMDYYLLSES